MILLILIISIIAIISLIVDCIMLKKIKQLMLLDKRQQTYITDLINYNTKMVVLQKLFFCIQLITDENTKEIGIKKLKRNF